MDESKLSPKEQVEYMLQRAKILEEQKQQKQKEEKEKFIPVVTVEEQHLPALLTPVTGLNLFEDEIDTEQTILSKFKVDEDAYKGVNITPEKVKKVKKSLGRMTTGVAAAVPLSCRGIECSYSSTCLTGDTLILTSTFKEVPLKDINIGDKIYSANKDYILERQTVTNKICNGEKYVYKLTTKSDRVLKLTANHKVASYLDNEIRWIALEDGLQIGHKVLVVEDLEDNNVFTDNYGDLLIDEIVEIEELGLLEVYDIEVEKNHNFIASGILVHNCNIEGTPVLTSEGYKNIEDLDSKKDKIVSRSKVGQLSVSGRSFTKASREYEGEVIKIQTSRGEYTSTPNHICYAAYNDNCFDKHVIYIMQKGNFFRVGQTQMLRRYGNDGRIADKFKNRCLQEEADRGWVIAICDNKIDANMTEAYYSSKFCLPQAVFVTNHKTKNSSKWNGQNKNVTQQQLNNLFTRVCNEPEYYYDLLRSIGKYPEYPDWTVSEKGENRKSTNTVFKIFACNLIDGLYNVLELTVPKDLKLNAILGNDRSIREIVPCKITREFYKGLVYSLDVERDHNYFADGILTRNCIFFKEDIHVEGEPCLAEVYVAEYWTKKYMEDLNIDPNSITEVHTVSRLVEISILENRLTQYMSIHQPDLTMDVVTAVGDDGDPIYNKASSIAFEQRERLDRSKLKILESLAATREKKMKIQISAQNTTNATSSLASVKNSLEALAEDLKRMNGIKTVNQ